MKLSNLVGSCVNLLMPAECPICGIRRAVYPFPICGACRKTLLSGPVLTSTSSRLIPEIRSCLSYDGLIEICIKQFKYHSRKEMVRVFCDLVQEYLSQKPIEPRTVDIMIPVPICAARYRKRRYNQSGLIAGVLSRFLLVPVRAHNLIKTKNTPPQIGLSRNERINNIRGSFSTIKPSLLAGKSILLVDDVMTTGTTLDACAEELIRAGARKVTGFTLARTL